MALFGGNMWYPMSIVIIFGLLIGTVPLGSAYFIFLFNDGKIIEEQNTNIKNDTKAIKPIIIATPPKLENPSSPPEINAAEHEYENSLHDSILNNDNNNEMKEENISYIDDKLSKKKKMKNKFILLILVFVISGCKDFKQVQESQEFQTLSTPLPHEWHSKIKNADIELLQKGWLAESMTLMFHLLQNKYYKTIKI